MITDSELAIEYDNDFFKSVSMPYYYWIEEPGRQLACICNNLTLWYIEIEWIVFAPADICNQVANTSCMKVGYFFLCLRRFSDHLRTIDDCMWEQRRGSLWISKIIGVVWFLWNIRIYPVLVGLKSVVFYLLHSIIQIWVH